MIWIIKLLLENMIFFLCKVEIFFESIKFLILTKIIIIYNYNNIVIKWLVLKFIESNFSSTNEMT